VVAGLSTASEADLAEVRDGLPATVEDWFPKFDLDGDHQVRPAEVFAMQAPSAGEPADALSGFLSLARQEMALGAGGEDVPALTGVSVDEITAVPRDEIARFIGTLRAFRRGDVNDDGVTDISDPIAALGFLFLGAPDRLACPKSTDANDDGVIDISDPVLFLSNLFLGGQPIPEPFANCALDPTADNLPCDAFTYCPEPGTSRLAATLRSWGFGWLEPGGVAEAGRGKGACVSIERKAAGGGSVTGGASTHPARLRKEVVRAP
jgi:hypothetical protein